MNTELKHKLQAAILEDNPDKFMLLISECDDHCSPNFAIELDELYPLNLRELFELGPMVPFAGHSLGPTFKPANQAIEAINKLQKEQLHAGHFPDTPPFAGNWFDCDIDPESIAAMQDMLGFKQSNEFVFTQTGLSNNLGNLLSTFYTPTLQNWQEGKTKICLLETEFFSDQAIVHSILRRGIMTANHFKVFTDAYAPTEASLMLKILANEHGLYDSDSIIEFVKKHAYEIQVLHLSDIVFSTGQRLNIPLILNELKNTIKEHNIIVGLDLAHTVGNRTIKLEELEVVTYAVGCSYKHCCGTAGSPFGIYVNRNVDLNAFPPIQGWKAADPNKVFAQINGFDADIMTNSGAIAFRTSNPSPVALAPIQTYVRAMHAIGWNKLLTKSECLTRYMLESLKLHLGDTLQLITPEEPSQRGATLVFRIRGLKNVHAVEDALKQEDELGRFEVDTRPPNNIRVTAHYGYIRFYDIQRMVIRLEQVINQVLAKESSATASPLPKISIFQPAEAQLGNKLPLCIDLTT